MKETSKQLMIQVKDAFTKLQAAMAAVEADVRAEQDIHELTDAALALRESFKFVHDLRADIMRTREVATRKACLMWARDARYANGDSIKTDYCTATPDVRIVPAVPTMKKDPETFSMMMQHMGIDSSLFTDLEDGEGRATQAVKPHWPGMIAYVNRLMAEGKPLPPGFDPEATHAQYKLNIRAKKGVHIED